MPEVSIAVDSLWRGTISHLLFYQIDDWPFRCCSTAELLMVAFPSMLAAKFSQQLTLPCRQIYRFAEYPELHGCTPSKLLGVLPRLHGSILPCFLDTARSGIRLCAAKQVWLRYCGMIPTSRWRFVIPSAHDGSEECAQLRGSRMW